MSDHPARAYAGARSASADSGVGSAVSPTSGTGGRQACRFSVTRNGVPGRQWAATARSTSSSGRTSARSRLPVPEVGDTAEPTPESALADLAPAYARAGWSLAGADYLGPDELAGLGTSWTKRLNSSRAALDVLALRGTITPR